MRFSTKSLFYSYSYTHQLLHTYTHAQTAMKKALFHRISNNLTIGDGDGDGASSSPRRSENLFANANGSKIQQKDQKSSSASSLSVQPRSLQALHAEIFNLPQNDASFGANLPQTRNSASWRQSGILSRESRGNAEPRPPSTYTSVALRCLCFCA